MTFSRLFLFLKPDFLSLGLPIVEVTVSPVLHYLWLTRTLFHWFALAMPGIRGRSWCLCFNLSLCMSTLLLWCCSRESLSWVQVYFTPSQAYYVSVPVALLALRSFPSPPDTLLYSVHPHTSVHIVAGHFLPTASQQGRTTTWCSRIDNAEFQTICYCFWQQYQ